MGDVPLWSEDEAQELLPYDGSARLTCPFGMDDAVRILSALLSEVPWERREISVLGRLVEQPRLTAWYGDPGRTYRYSGLELTPLAWSQTMLELKAASEREAGFKFNSALANLYRDGSDGVAWHSDNEPELGVEPVICSLSFGSPRRFDLRHKDSGETVKHVLPAGSALVMSGTTQRCWKHQIPKTKRNIGPRVNVTFPTIV